MSLLVLCPSPPNMVVCGQFLELCQLSLVIPHLITLSLPFPSSRLNSSQPATRVCYPSGGRCLAMPLSHSVPRMCLEPGLPHFPRLLLASMDMVLCGSPNPIYRTPYPTALLAIAEAYLSARARSPPCPEPRHRPGPRSDHPMSVACLPPCAASLSPERRWQVPGSCISLGPGLPSATLLPILPSASSPPGLAPLAQGGQSRPRS